MRLVVILNTQQPSAQSPGGAAGMIQESSYMGLGVAAYIRGGGAGKLRGMIIGIWAVAKRGTPEHSGPKQGGVRTLSLLYACVAN